MKVVHELTLEELIFTAITMLMGEEGIDYAYYNQDAEWWALRLSTRIN